MRFAAKGNGTFGILLWRVIQRYTETITWPLYRGSKTGFTSQFADLTGLDGLSSPGHAEITPYFVTKNVQGPAADNFARSQDVTAGGDLKYRIASNLLLNATVNPDFGQVEADPSVLNLSAFETFFSERRPFFVEGKGLFTFNVNCVIVVDCNTGEGLFYSRRIGRSPQLAGTYGDESSPTATRILGAAKVTGRLPGGFSLGVLDAVTDNVRRPRRCRDPRAHHQLRRGARQPGLQRRQRERRLHRDRREPLARCDERAVPARKRVQRRPRCAPSLCRAVRGLRLARLQPSVGNAAAIAQTQRSPVHLYQRPDGPLTFDSTRTSLAGTNAEVRFAKVGGDRLHFETAYQRRSAGFEINDIGFLRQADQQEWTSWAALAFRKPNRIYQQLRWNFNNWEYWTVAGLPTERAFNSNVHIQFTNRWWLHMGGTLGQLGTRTATAAPGADPRYGRTPTSPPGSASREMTGTRWCHRSR